jgi:hypothetical protein
MSLAELTRPEAVGAAMDEFDELGRDPFLEKYGYGRAKRYFVRRDGQLYDSKAIAGVAVGFQHPERGPMQNSEFSGGESSVVRRLSELGFETVDTRAGSATLTLPQDEVDAFARTLETTEYATTERDYKVAVHEVISRLLSREMRERSGFPELLAALFERRLDLALLGLEEEERTHVEAAVSGAPFYGVTNAFVNLAGGGFAVNNFVWIPAAVEKGFGESLREAFGALVDPDSDLAERVELFRASLYATEEASQAAGGFRPEWNLIRISLAFTAALLGAFDPTRYTPYHQGKLRKSYEDFVGPWPREQGGKLYETVCDFVQRVGEALEEQGAPIHDLIDAQSFLWLRASAAEGPADEDTVDEAGVPAALHLVAKWSARYGADTVALHREVADRSGEVWWGVIGSSERKKIADEHLQRLQSQLERGVETRVFLAGSASSPVVKTRLSDIRATRPIDEELIPSYYPSNLHHSLWLKLRDFSELSQVELLQMLEPNAEPGRIVTLTNQANPLLVRIRSAPRVWWVNQGSSFRRAREGGYLWAPLIDRAGRGHEHWDALQYARMGDVVLNHADGQIRGVSRVMRTAYASERPDPEADQAWNKDGRRVDVEYRDLETPLPVSAIPEGRRQREGGPFDRDGGVKQAYFFPLSDAFVHVLSGLSPELASLLPTDKETITRVTPGGAYAEPGFEEIVEAVLAKGMALSERTIRRYHLSLRSRGFVVLSGVSGTGKTWLAQVYASAVGAKQAVVPVAPNWTTNEDLLGYRSPLDGVYRDTQFSSFLREASSEWEAALRENRTARPYHAILDEMNLARVEYYFAKFLSAMELRAREGKAEIELAADDVVTLGPNLLFVGTVNIDETTHLFADKVFDRAQLVELEVDREALEAHIGDQPYARTLLACWDALSEVAPFAYRIVDEIGIYVAHAAELGIDWREALDEQMFQKLLPKLKGADPRVGSALEAFIELTGEDFPLSRGKAEAMREGFVQHGFSSYF